MSDRIPTTVAAQNTNGFLLDATTRGFVAPRISILAVAPYESLAAILEREVRTYPDVHMTVVVGNLVKGLERAIEQLVEPFDLILSRGGTANLLREHLDIPVIDVKTSAFDVLQAIQLSEGISGKRAVVGFSGITDAARNTSDVLQLGLDIFTLVDENDAADITGLLKDEGYNTILCDVISNTVFREAGFNTVLITSGAASVRESIDEAIRMTHYIRDAREENRFLRSVIQGHSGDTVILNAEGRLFFTTLDRGGSAQILSMLRELLPQVVAGDADTIRRSIGGHQYIIRTMVDSRTRLNLVTFYITQSRLTSGSRQSGIAFFTRNEAHQEYLDSPFSLSGDINGISQIIQSATDSLKPLLITGEYGTGRTAVACFAYCNSSRASHPLVEIDCGMLTDRSREFLLNARNSPLFSSDLTLHIKNMDTSPDSFISSLLTTISATALVERSSVFFSCDPRGKHVSSFISYIKDKFQCVEVELMPIRSNRERIPTIANLYLSQLNADIPKEVLHIDRQALQLLGDYPWPGNYIQFRRVISQLCLISRDHTIRAADVRSLLALERPVYQNQSGDAQTVELDLERSLEQIERDIAEIVVRRNGGNQSAAARQLGISRTTLWRMTRDVGEG